MYLPIYKNISPTLKIKRFFNLLLLANNKRKHCIDNDRLQQQHMLSVSALAQWLEGTAATLR